jgi:methionyl-tRNA synthetase
VFLTGFVTDRGQKLSKSQIAALPPEEQSRLRERIDPLILAARFGVDNLRYTLLREVTLGQDGEYNRECSSRARTPSSPTTWATS